MNKTIISAITFIVAITVASLGLLGAVLITQIGISIRFEQTKSIQEACLTSVGNKYKNLDLEGIPYSVSKDIYKFKLQEESNCFKW